MDAAKIFGKEADNVLITERMFDTSDVRLKLSIYNLN